MYLSKVFIHIILPYTKGKRKKKIYTKLIKLELFHLKYIEVVHLKP